MSECRGAEATQTDEHALHTEYTQYLHAGPIVSVYTQPEASRILRSHEDNTMRDDTSEVERFSARSA